MIIKTCSKSGDFAQRWVWQNGYHAEIAESNWFIKQKIQYIHNNPVVEKIVERPEDYYFSSARNYAELDNDLEVFVLNLF